MLIGSTLLFVASNAIMGGLFFLVFLAIRGDIEWAVLLFAVAVALAAIGVYGAVLLRLVTRRLEGTSSRLPRTLRLAVRGSFAVAVLLAVIGALYAAGAFS